jgi:hypothetical protein
MASLNDKKCNECGGDLIVCFEEQRTFYTDASGNLIEDENEKFFFPSNLYIRCTDDSEHVWKREDDLDTDEWEEEIYDQIEKKFINV